MKISEIGGNTTVILSVSEASIVPIHYYTWRSRYAIIPRKAEWIGRWLRMIWREKFEKPKQVKIWRELKDVTPEEIRVAFRSADTIDPQDWLEPEELIFRFVVQECILD
jgi:hypothetical protein